MFNLVVAIVENNISLIDWVKLSIDVIIAIIAISGVYFSVITLKRSDKSHELTLREIEKADKRYSIENMPLIKFEAPDVLLVEGLKLMSGEEVDFAFPSYLKNVGLGTAKNINLKIKGIYEGEPNRFRDGGKKAGFNIADGYSLPIFKYDENGELHKGIQFNFSKETIDDIYCSVISKGELYELPDDHLNGLLIRTAIDFYYQSTLRGFNKLIYVIDIDYESIFGEKIKTRQLIERTYIATSGQSEVIDDVSYGDIDIQIFFKEHDIEFHSEILK